MVSPDEETRPHNLGASTNVKLMGMILGLPTLLSRSKAAEMTGPSVFPVLPGSAVESNVGGFASYAVERFSHLNQLAGVTRGWEDTDHVVGNRLIDTIADLQVLSQVEFARAPTFLSFGAG
jgi:hypothetical protein